MDYQEFTVRSGIGGTPYECRFRNLITGISPRHSDTADIKFLVNGKPAVVALPLAALAEIRKRAGQPLTDAEVIRIAALVLKETLEKEGVGEDRMVVASAERTVALAGQIHSLAPA